MIRHTPERDAADTRMMIMKLQEIERHLDEITNIESDLSIDLIRPNGEFVKRDLQRKK
jgi:hypothetical protein